MSDELRVGPACIPLGGCVGAYFDEWKARAERAEAIVAAAETLSEQFFTLSNDEGWQTVAVRAAYRDASRALNIILNPRA